MTGHQEKGGKREKERDGKRGGREQERWKASHLWTDLILGVHKVKLKYRVTNHYKTGTL